ncbi:TatD family hydrolase [Marinomonas ostreistagni]|uniref:TatD family hydrolase n=1 Tax=Marinomonas ostreistagni TaxID=359209 RepID=UPI00194DCE53|nr:TatD family hydrolase [Marinomonas ostreistagni]MBM6550285.1 TatD family hydrolase [Marinomonas ostreistagni]
MLIDTHCHLDKLDLTPYENGVDDAIRAAKDAGVSQILTISVDLDNFDSVHDFTKYAGVFASCGVHPLHKEGLLTSPETLEQLAQRKKVVAIGETGLDYFYDKEPELHQAQKDSFAVHLDVAGRMGLPTIIHTRDARADTLDLIRAHGDSDVGGVLHCFTEDYAMARSALDLNYLISISGIVTFKNAEDLRDTVRKLPLESLIVETDSPYLAPIPHRGKKNEPKYVRDVAQFVADIKNIRYEELLEISSQNFHNKFTQVTRDEVLL